MSKFKRLAAVLLSAVMLVCALSVTAGAASIESTAKSISSGKTYSAQLFSSQDNADFKIEAKKDGFLKLNLTVKLSTFNVIVLDENGNEVKVAETKISSGYNNIYYDTKYYWNDNVEKFVGIITYKITKGTYYIRLNHPTYDNGYDIKGNGKLSLTATFPSGSSAKLTGIIVPMKVYGTLQLSAAASASTSETVKWSSSNTSVATVSSTGKVTAKKKGTATITAKLGDSSASIVIKVT